MLMILENPKVAVSSSPLGTIAGVQFEAVYQSVLVALTFQVALLAKAVLAAKTRDAGRIVAMSVAPSRCGSARRLNLAGCFFMDFLSRGVRIRRITGRLYGICSVSVVSTLREALYSRVG